MNKWLKYLVGISAIIIAGCAAYFSITGLGILFAGASISVMVMAGSLEYAKLVTATYLKQKWDTIKGFNKWYLTSAVIILMAITSAGIFGYLSNAFQQQNIKLDQVQREIDVWNNKIKTDTSQIALYTNQLNQLQSNSNTVLSNNTNRSSLRFATSTGKEQSKIRAKISVLNDSIVAYNSHINDIKNNNINLEREVGGFRFVAEAFGMSLNSVVKFFIFLIVIVFDPLAIALVIAFNQLTMNESEDNNSPFQKELKDFVEGYDEKTYSDELKNFVDETTRVHLSEDDLKKLEAALLNPPPPNDVLKQAAEKLKDRELFPEANQRAKEILENSNIKEILSTNEPTEEEELENFSTIEPNSENFFYDDSIPEEKITKALNEIENQTFSEAPSSLIKERAPEHKPKFVEYTTPTSNNNEEEKKNL